MSSSNLLLGHTACPHCDSSDAYSIYDDGHGYCFSCNTYDPPTQETDTEVLGHQTIEFIPWRSFSLDTLRFFGVHTVVSGDTPDYVEYPWPNGMLQCRKFDSHTFWVKGDKKQKSEPQLFGTDKFSAGSAKAVTLCEGVSDAMAVYEMLGSQYPVLAVKSASSAKKDVQAEWDYVNSFDKIYICFDPDAPGQKATREVAQLFDIRKVHEVKLTKKDAKTYHDDEEWKQFKNIWFNARKFIPEGIITSYEEIQNELNSLSLEPFVDYPFNSWNEKLKGIHESECILITGLEGLGKTEIMGALEHHVLSTTDYNIGIIHAEEPPSRAVRRLANYDEGQIQEDTNQIFEKYKQLTGTEGRCPIYRPVGADAQTILDNIRFMVAALDCKVIFFDHITMLATGLELGDDERRTLDWFSTGLRYLLDELSFSLVLVSHVNDEGKTRGSRNVSKIANTWIHIDRNLQAPNDIERNTTYITINKARETGNTGPAGSLFFDQILREQIPDTEEMPEAETKKAAFEAA